MAALYGNPQTGLIVGKRKLRYENESEFVHIVQDDYTYSIWRMELKNGTYKFLATKNIPDHEMKRLKHMGWELIKEQDTNLKGGVAV
ncbi:hypothetical protein [Brevibacillus borstelensis]|uniref:hypothetical protein n=1 Tax=Brevibacillus borstelensis TaxID=45462 RepID=UPI00203D4DF9|nr:hypothetical protein [Brevibacillus borstelensis]MCM3473690.1 hypothetical protein [Brevibacillus borstelensis]MED1855151.1 hypothetical protein [Brevibacillus borstelensis]